MKETEFIINSINFLKTILHNDSKLHIVYAYDKLTNFHIVEISPENIRRANNLYMDWEYNTIKEFTELFPNSDILISDIDKSNDMSNIIYK